MLRVSLGHHITLFFTCTEFSGAVEDPFSILSALVPDLSCSPLVTPLFPSPAQDSSQTNLPLPINVPPPESSHAISPPEPQSMGSNKSKYRHWSITRPAPQRGRVKDHVEERPPTPDWRKPRPLHTTDFGLYPSLATKRSPGGGTSEVLATQERLFEALYTSLENAVRSSLETTPIDAAATPAAQSWLQEVVYGGFDGLAYMRSVAEFVTAANTDDASDRDLNAALAGYVDAVLINELTERRHRTIEAALADYDAGVSIPRPNSPVTTPTPTPLTPAVAPPEPPVVPATQLDLASLISAPNELFDAENAWVGAGAKTEDAAVLSRALDHASHLFFQLLHAKQSVGEAEAEAEAGMDVVESESGSEEEEEEEESGVGAGTSKERELLLETELRMNLIALAKRAPLDQIARMPPELVPPYLRQIVPTIGS